MIVACNYLFATPNIVQVFRILRIFVGVVDLDDKESRDSVFVARAFVEHSLTFLRNGSCEGSLLFDVELKDAESAFTGSAGQHVVVDVLADLEVLEILLSVIKRNPEDTVIRFNHFTKLAQLIGPQVGFIAPVSFPLECAPGVANLAKYHFLAVEIDGHDLQDGVGVTGHDTKLFEIIHLSLVAPVNG